MLQILQSSKLLCNSICKLILKSKKFVKLIVKSKGLMNIPAIGVCKSEIGGVLVVFALEPNKKNLNFKEKLTLTV